MAGEWGRPSLHIDALFPRAYPQCAIMSAFSLPTKANSNPDRIFPHSPSEDDVLLFSDGLKPINTDGPGSGTEPRAGAAFIHLHPTGSIVESHPLPPWYMARNSMLLAACSSTLQCFSYAYVSEIPVTPEVPRYILHSSIVHVATSWSLRARR